MNKCCMCLALLGILILIGCGNTEQPRPQNIVEKPQELTQFSEDNLILGEHIAKGDVEPLYCMSDKEELKKVLAAAVGPTGFETNLEITCHIPQDYQDNELNMEAFFDGIESPIMNPLGACKEGTNTYTIQFGINSDDDSYKTFSDIYHNIRICVWPKDDTTPTGRLDLKICKTKRVLLC